MKFSFFIVLQIILVINSFAQFQLEWTKRFDSQHQFWGDWAYGIAADSSGNVFVTGLIGSQTSHDIGTIKYNQYGEMLWLRNYGGSSELQDFGYDIAVDNDQNIYVTGQSYDTARKDFVVLKYDNFGNFKWESRDSGSGLFVRINSSNEIIAAGRYGNQIRVKKLSSNADVIWNKLILLNNSFGCNLTDVEITADDNILLGGSAEFALSKDDYLIVSLDNNGNIQWNRTFNGGLNYDDYLTDISTEGDNIYLTGYVQNNITNRDYYSLKLNGDGDSLWGKFYNSEAGANDFAYFITHDSNENVYVFGLSWIQNITTDYFNKCIKYDKFGNVADIKEYDLANGYFIPKSGTEKNGLFYLAGYGSQNNGDLKLIIVDTLLNEIQNISYNSPNNGSDWGTDLVFSNNNVFVTGIGSGIKEDYITCKFSQSIGINPISSDIPQHFSLHQNYPNPFNPSTKIKFEIPAGVVEVAHISVYDILGREVRTLVNENLKPGIYEAEFNAAELPSGVYFYRLSSGEFVYTKTMILIK